MHPETHAILISCDEKGEYEFPSKFDADAAEKSARKLNEDLIRHGIDTRFEDWIHNQDASFGLAIVLISAAKKSLRGTIEPTIRISNFGKMAAITFEDQLSIETLQIVKDAIKANSYFCMNEEELNEPYDGVNAPDQALPTWWIRYFDWI
jgi:hypothetical protein